MGQLARGEVRYALSIGQALLGSFRPAVVKKMYWSPHIHFLLVKSELKYINSSLWLLNARGQGEGGARNVLLGPNCNNVSSGCLWLIIPYCTFSHFSSQIPQDNRRNKKKCIQLPDPYRTKKCLPSSSVPEPEPVDPRLFGGAETVFWFLIVFKFF